MTNGAKTAAQNPYAGNILIGAMGPIPSPDEAMARLTFLPPLPEAVRCIPKHVRLHHLVRLREMHIPTWEEGRVATSADLIIRNSYLHRNPADTTTWQCINGTRSAAATPRVPAMASAVVGHSGTGKTECIQRALCGYPGQLIWHEHLPQTICPQAQLLWLSIDVPESGKTVDLARELMRTYDRVMREYIPDCPPRFESQLNSVKPDGMRLLAEWQQVALSKFLGILHLDEVQNFFKLPSLERRRGRKADGAPPQLSIVEDQCLKWILTLTNRWQIPVIFSGTPDGIGAMTSRMATIERLTAGGFHKLDPFSDPSSPAFKQIFLQRLVAYQYVAKPLPLTDELASLIVELTAGVPRLIIALWCGAHRIAFERTSDDLRLEDFRRAACTLLAPVAPAVKALRSGDPVKMARYEDLARLNDNFWESFWLPV